MNIWLRVVLIVAVVLFLCPLLLGWATPAEYYAELKQFVIERVLL